MKGIGTMKATLVAALALAAFAAGAYEIDISGDFAAGADGFPTGWSWHDYEGYLPHARVQVESAGELLIGETKGKGGAAIRSRRVPLTKDEILTVRAEVCGSGKAWITIYEWTKEGGWLMSQSPREVVLNPNWREVEYSFTADDLAGKRCATVEVALGVRPGANARFRNVSVWRRLTTAAILKSEDFESTKTLPGNPERIVDHIAPGLLSPTGQGVYKTDSRVDVIPSEKVELPSAESGAFLTSSYRLYAFGRAKRLPAKLVTGFKAGENKFLFAVDHDPAAAELTCAFSGGKKLRVPYASLPADFVFSAAASGTYELTVTSLADSSVRTVSGTSDFFSGAAGAEIVRKLALVAKDGVKTEVSLDNLQLARSEPEKQTALRYPYLAQPDLAFDPVKAGWPLVFEDEFDGTEVDSKKWDTNPGKEKREKQLKYAEVKDGKLLIKADYKPGTTNLATAGFWSEQTYKYGYFEARLKFTTYNGWWAAFWICSRATGNPFMDGFEIDVFEDYYMRNDARNKLDHNLHTKGGGPLKSWNYNSTLPGTHKDWYTIGCKWTPFEITYYIDGKAIPSTSSHSPYKTVTFDAFRHAACIMPLHAIVSGQIMSTAYGRHEATPDEVYPEIFEVDRVRVYGWPGSAPGAAPTVSFTSAAANRFAVTPGSPIDVNVTVKPAAKTGAKIKAVHLFDDGYYLETKTEPPYDFVVPMTKDYFNKTAWMKPGRSGIRPDFDGSMHVFCAFAEDETGMVGHSETMSFMIAPPGKSRPFRGIAHPVPGKVVIGHYDEGGPGIAYCDSTEGNNGAKDWRQDDWVDGGEHSIGSVASGEWVNYTIDVKKAGRYRLKLVYGTPSKFPHYVNYLLDGEKIGTTGRLKHHEEDHWGADTIAETPVALPAGQHVLTLHLFGQFNLGDFTIEEM